MEVLNTNFLVDMRCSGGLLNPLIFNDVLQVL